MIPREAMGASPQASAGLKALPPEQMKALRQDPEIQQAVSMVVGKKIDLSQIPDDMMMMIAGMVHKLGVQGAVQKFMSGVKPEQLQQIRGSL